MCAPASPSLPGVIDKLLAALNDHSARIVAAVSSTQREADELYLPHFAPSSAISDQTSVEPASLTFSHLGR
jgi:hypothetical protein